MLFVYYAMKEAAKKSVAEKFVYTVSFSQEFEGAEGRVFLDDSLLYGGSPVIPDSIITAQRYTTRATNNEGKVQQQVHFTESSVLRVEVAGVDTVEMVVGTYRWDFNGTLTSSKDKNDLTLSPLSKDNGAHLFT